MSTTTDAADAPSAAILRCWHEALAIALALREKKENDLADRAMRLADQLADAAHLARHAEGGGA